MTTCEIPRPFEAGRYVQVKPRRNPSDRAKTSFSFLIGIAIALQAGGAVGQAPSGKPKPVESVIGKVVGTLSFKGYRIPVVSGCWW